MSAVRTQSSPQSVPSNPAPDPVTPKEKAAAPREWMPRMWQGCSLEAWLRFMIRNRCAVELPYCYIPCVVTAVSICHTLLRLVQDAWFGDRVKTAPLRHAPLFIIGHWRTGTTLLHEC